MSGLGKKHIKHTSPAVRMHAASLMGGFFGSSKESQAVVVTAAKGEKDPAVLYYMIRSVGSSIAKNPDVKMLIMENTNHCKASTEKLNWIQRSFSASHNMTA